MGAGITNATIIMTATMAPAVATQNHGGRIIRPIDRGTMIDDTLFLLRRSPHQSLISVLAGYLQLSDSGKATMPSLFVGIGTGERDQRRDGIPVCSPIV